MDSQKRVFPLLSIKKEPSVKYTTEELKNKLILFPKPSVPLHQAPFQPDNSGTVIYI